MPKGSNPRFKDLTGMIFGRLTVCEMTCSPNPKITRKFWRCVCSCGNSKIVPSHQLVQGLTKSCGCLKKESPGRQIGRKDDVLFRKSRIPPETIQSRLPENLTIDLTTYVSGNKPARFVDSEFGEFTAVVNQVIGGLVKHPIRGKINMGVNRKRLFDVRAVSEEWDVPYSTLCFVARTYGDEFAIEYAKTRVDYVSSLEKFVIKTMGYERFNRSLVGKYRPDFKLSETLYLNSDGPMYHSEFYKKPEDHQKMRRAYETAGLQLLQFYAHEIVHTPQIVKSIVSAKLGELQSVVYARKTSVRKLTHVESKPFLETNHLMGWAPASYYALVDKDKQIVACIGVRNKQGVVDVTRFCSRVGLSVVGGLSKLIAHIKLTYTPQSIESWVDLRYGTGESLVRLGFQETKETLGWRWTDGFMTFNRLSCRAKMDARGLTEQEYAAEKKWYKIHDAGQRLYRLRLLA